MKWVTREHPSTDRIACPWLIRRFIDPDAEIVYVPRDQVLAYADREGAISFDAPGARYTHRDGLCSFEVLVQDHAIGDPPVALTLSLALPPRRTRRQRVSVRPVERGAPGPPVGFDGPSGPADCPSASSVPQPRLSGAAMRRTVLDGTRRPESPCVRSPCRPPYQPMRRSS